MLIRDKAMQSRARTAEPFPAPDAWREGVQHAMLTIAAAVTPPIAIVTIALRAGTWAWPDNVAMGVVALLAPMCRFARGPLAVRSFLMLAVAFGAAFYFLSRNGLAGGISVGLVTLTILASLATGRSTGRAFIALTAVAYAFVGLLAHHQHVAINSTASDPTLLRNWLRIGVVNSLLSILLVGVVEYVVRHVEANSRAANAALKRLRAAYDKLETTKEDERRFLSHELHDELGQTLTALKLSLQIGARPHEPAAPKRGPAIPPLALVEDLIARVRKISLDLRPPLLDEVGLVSALRAYLQSQAGVSGVTMQLHAAQSGDELPFRLPAEYEIACFRVAQESVTNVLRHAAASRIDVHVGRVANHLSLSITDDGCGFDPSTLDDAAAHGHLGVLGMRERIRARGGQFRLTSTPGRGTTVEIEVDVPPIVR